MAASSNKKLSYRRYWFEKEKKPAEYRRKKMAKNFRLNFDPFPFHFPNFLGHLEQKNFHFFCQSHFFSSIHLSQYMCWPLNRILLVLIGFRYPSLRKSGNRNKKFAQGEWNELESSSRYSFHFDKFSLLENCRLRTTRPGTIN